MLIWKSPDSLKVHLELHQLTDVLVPLDLEFLSFEEKKRSQEITNPEANELYLKSRWLLKSKLSELTKVPLTQLDFKIVGEGKPELRDEALKLDFNISHKEKYCLIGWTWLGATGVDLEIDHQKDYKANVAKRFLNEKEISEIESAENFQRTFLKFWSFKEALVKLNAGSLFKDAKNTEVSLKNFEVLSGPAHFYPADETKCHIFEVENQFLISVAWTEGKKKPGSKSLV